MQWLLYGLAVVAGVLNAVQPGCNAALKRGLEVPFVAGMIVAAVTFTSLLLAGLLFGQIAWPSGERLARVPWWGWVGGALGAVYVLSMLLVAERVGAALFLGLTVTTAIVTSLALDHFGWVGFKEHPVNLWRALGGLLMIAGLGLIAKF